MSGQAIGLLLFISVIANFILVPWAVYEHEQAATLKRSGVRIQARIVRARRGVRNREKFPFIRYVPDRDAEYMGDLWGEFRFSRQWNIPHKDVFYQITCQFEHGGKVFEKHHVVTFNDFANLARSMTVPVIYLPEKPDISDIDGWETANRDTVAVLAWFSVLITVGLALTAIFAGRPCSGC